LSKNLARSLVIILLIPYSLFLFEFLAKDVTFRNIIKVATSVFGPLPLAIFFAYVFVAKKNILQEIDESHLSIFASVSYLLGTFVMTLFWLYLFEGLVYPQFSETVVPIFLNSLVLLMYITNILVTKSLKIIAILSGISMAISIQVLFLA
jgi:hypothetical protein